MRTDIGGLTFAFGWQYQRMAYALALSLKKQGLPLTVVVPVTELDNVGGLERVAHVVPLAGEFNKFEYEIYAYKLSPYDLTIKFDADMLVPAETYLWQAISRLDHFELLSGNACDLLGTTNSATIYRRVEAEHDLPTVYSACFGFKKGKLAQLFFEKVEEYFSKWYAMPLAEKLPPTTDTIYSLAWKVLELQHLATGLPFVHMKPGIAGSSVPYNWTRHIPYVLDDRGRLRVNSHPIRLPFHYFDKEFMSDQMIARLEQCLQ